MNSTRSLFLVPILLLALRAGAQSPETLVVEAREVELSYPAEAVIEAVKQATVAAQVQGRIVDVRVDAGQKVRAGEVLMRIDEREAVHGVAAAQAGLTNAKANYERSRNLFAQKFISQAALDKAEADYKGAAATAGQAGTVATFSTITAPIAGVIAERQAERGEMAAPGRPLLTIFDPKGLRAVAEIPQYKLADLPQKPRARIEFPESGKWLEASRVEILPTADARSHSVRARVYLPEDAAGVIPGMFARVHFVVGKAKKLTLPAASSGRYTRARTL
jgi:RND family efflux transporter MFP subunit